ncbi:MAG: NAD(P)/FAD-dependent oxidoreductase [Acidimicrobiales bacterium]
MRANGRAVVVGASLAGLRAVETLRGQGHVGEIVVVGAEKHMPYDRPPLSKQFLAGTWGLDRVMLRPDDKISALEATWRLGTRATALDTESHTVELDDGTVLVYDGLVLATGATPRLLPGTAGMVGVHTLRTLDDCMALSAAVENPDARLVVVGAGFIGAEVAATCRRRGLAVTVVEGLPVPLARVLGDAMGAACADLQRSNGVDLRTGVGVAGLRSAASPGTGALKVQAVELLDGTVIPADVVVAGVGVEPVTEWLEGSGVEISNGVVTDATLHAAPSVVVAGDLARYFDVSVGTDMRIEHWTNAVEQGAHAAQSLLAGDEAAEYRTVPYFWSDQYDVKIQVLGHTYPDDDVEVVDGDVAAGRFVALYGSGGMLRGALGFGRPRQLMGYRALIEAGASFDEALAHEPG